MLLNQYDRPDPELLRRIKSLSSLSDGQLVVLANQLRVHQAGNKEYLLHQQDNDSRDIYLISGSIELRARDGKKRQITVTRKDEIKPIAQLRPSIYDVITRSKVEYLKIDTEKLNEFIEQSSADMGEISVHTLIGEQDEPDTSITRNFFQQLTSGGYSMPPLPSAASRIQSVYRGDATDVKKLINILVSYPDVVRILTSIAKIKASDHDCAADRIRESINRLGVSSAYYLMMIYSVGTLIHRLPEQARVQILPWWEHCLDVAAISRMLAKKTGLVSADLAMMSGLLHGIGGYSLVHFLSQQDQLKPDEEEVQVTIATMRAQLSGLLLRKWNFGDNVIVAAEECGVWSRKPDAAPDLCDLVLVAHYFSALKDNHIGQLPPTAAVPAFGKLKLDFNHGRELLENTEVVKNNIKKLFARLDSI